jgi:hypothetical protein
MTDMEILPPVQDEEAVSEFQPYEAEELARCEKIIDAGIRNFVEVGNALMRIRDLRLYRDTHQTFEAYLSDRWDLSRQYGYQLIASAQAAENVSAIGRHPDNERQVRLLAQLDPETQRRAWKRAMELAEAENGKVSSRLVETAIGEIQAEDSCGKVPEKTKNKAPAGNADLRNFGRIQALASRLEGAIERFLQKAGNNDLMEIHESVKDIQARLEAFQKGWF